MGSDVVTGSPPPQQPAARGVRQADEQDGDEDAHLYQARGAEVGLADHGGPGEEVDRVDGEDHVEEGVDEVAHVGLRPPLPDRVDTALVGAQLGRGRSARGEQPARPHGRDEQQHTYDPDGGDDGIGRHASQPSAPAVCRPVRTAGRVVRSVGRDRDKRPERRTRGVRRRGATYDGGGVLTPPDDVGGCNGSLVGEAVMSSKPVQRLERVVIRFAGDSGDGMQLTGDRFTSETAILGNDLSTLPNFPAEIRAPQGTLPGVSSFQLHFADHDVLTPGDAPDVLVAMNPAALKANLRDVPRGATIIVNTDEFSKRNLAKVGYAESPVEDGSLDSYHLHPVALTSITVEALADFDLSRKDKERAKNMFALGLLSWLYTRPPEGTERFLKAQFGPKPEILEANLAALHAGYQYGETTEDFAVSYEIAPATLPAGTYRNITGNTALAYGLVAAAHRAGLPMVLGAYPITPASDILHTLSSLKRYGVTTMQAEDEIAGIGAALGASFAGSLGVTTTSGPGIALKAETIGLAVSLELPLVIVDVQRGGPSTGLPTKTEQADLLQAMFGRNGESPVPIVAPQTPADCFRAAMDAVRIATTYRTPVFLLSDGYLANGSEPWTVPSVDELPDLHVEFASAPNGTDPKGEPTFHPFLRDEETLA